MARRGAKASKQSPTTASIDPTSTSPPPQVSFANDENDSNDKVTTTHLSMPSEDFEKAVDQVLFANLGLRASSGLYRVVQGLCAHYEATSSACETTSSLDHSICVTLALWMNDLSVQVDNWVPSYLSDPAVVDTSIMTGCKDALWSSLVDSFTHVLTGASECLYDNQHSNNTTFSKEEYKTAAVGFVGWCTAWAMDEANDTIDSYQSSLRAAKLVNSLKAISAVCAYEVIHCDPTIPFITNSNQPIDTPTSNSISATTKTTETTSPAKSLTSSSANQKSTLFGLFSIFVINSDDARLKPCVSCRDEEYMASDFKVLFVDNYGSMFNLLNQLSNLKHAARCNTVATENYNQTISHTPENAYAINEAENVLVNTPPVSLAVDCEGVSLSRFGQLALIQISLSIEPNTVYVIDVAKLGQNAFELTSMTGCSLRRVLEDEEIRKVFYDPRHDLDAIYHQFGVHTRNVFDLQLAEVAMRRSRGLNVRYVTGLYKCLQNQPKLLNDTQKKLAETINEKGKSLFEPDHGGDYSLFLTRPLHPALLVYSSHDARYLLTLLDYFESELSQKESWLERVCQASEQRALFMLNEYLPPTSDAPDF